MTTQTEEASNYDGFVYTRDTYDMLEYLRLLLPASNLLLLLIQLDLTIFREESELEYHNYQKCYQYMYGYHHSHV